MKNDRYQNLTPKKTKKQAARERKEAKKLAKKRQAEEKKLAKKRQTEEKKLAKQQAKESKKNQRQLKRKPVKPKKVKPQKKVKPPKKPKKRIKIKKRTFGFILAICLLIAAVKIFYLSVKEYTFNSITVTSSSLPQDFNGFKIAFITDTNLKTQSDLTRLSSIVSALNKKNCDMVLFGGDLFDSEPFDASKVTRILKSIKTSYGKFAVFGEVDEEFSENVTSILAEGGFELLQDEKRKIYYKDSYINLYGLDVKTLELEKKKNYTILLSHYPDNYAFAYDKINLQLSGHSGGGYIHIPFYGPLVKRNHALSYNYGTYKEGKSQLIVSNGLDVTSGYHFRLFEDNEIIIITLKSS